jgi:hypothetical protein
MSVDDGIDERLQAVEGSPGHVIVLKGEPAQATKKRRGNRGKVAATGIVDRGKKVLMNNNNIGTQRGDREEDDNSVANCASTLSSQPPAAPANEELTGVSPVTSEPGSAASESPAVLPCYSVGKGVFLPFGQLLHQCCHCRLNALIAWSNRSNPAENGVVCLEHGLANNYIRDLVLRWSVECRYRFISPEHEAALRAFLD